MAAPFKKLVQSTATKAVRQAKPVAPARLVRRPLTSSTSLLESDRPSFAQTDDTITEDYPENAQEEAGIGHATTGPGVGRHNDRTLSTFSMSGKVCVVTGAARGLGNLMARTFAESGCDSVVIMDLDGELATSAAKDLEDWFVEHGEADPGEITAVGMGVNVAEEDSVKAAFDEVVKKFGRIDVLVTAAGIVHNYSALDYPMDKYRQLWAVNVDGSYFCAREAARHMLAQGIEGSIVLVGSMSGSIVNIPQPQTPYNASKAAVAHMATSLAVEWAKSGIRVNCLAPGYMLTSLTRVILDNNPDLRDTWTSLTPMGRLGEPEDLKGAIIYLASDASKYTSGTTLTVDGAYCCT